MELHIHASKIDARSFDAWTRSKFPDIVTGDLKKFKVTQNLKHNGRDYPIGSEIVINPKEAASIGKHLFEAVSDKNGEAEE